MKLVIVPFSITSVLIDIFEAAHVGTWSRRICEGNMLTEGKVFHCFSIVISYCFQRSALLFYNQESSPAFKRFDYTITCGLALCQRKQN